ncbi:MAG: hypothetical protein WCJ56_09480 [bacterium]
MITYHIMDTAFTLPTCLHSGSLPISACLDARAYVESVSDIPPGTVARTLQDIAVRYGACGVLALEDELIIGKIRAYPQALLDLLPDPCVQQEQTIKPVIALNLDELPTKEACPVLRLYCMQVAGGYSGRGIAGGMLDALIAWAKTNGWREIRAGAGRAIPQLLNWSGSFSCAALARRGFTITSSAVSPEFRDGVVSQRAGYHGEAVQQQWKAYAHLSDDDAAQAFEMRLDMESA